MVWKRSFVTTLEGYLRCTGRALRSRRFGDGQGMPLLVMGSEAADLDSLACSLSYAQLLAVEHPRRLVTPLLPLMQRDLRLRPEAVFVLRRLGLRADLLPFLDDPGVEGLVSALRSGAPAEAALVDTNRPPVAVGEGLRVVEVIDHHIDDPRPEDPPAPGTEIGRERWRSEPVGSAATLVWEQLRRRGPGLLEAPSAGLLLAAILLDTVNLDPAAGRVTPRDVEAAGSLSALAGVSSDRYFHRLERERLKLSRLRAEELLRRDLKEERGAEATVGVSSLLLTERLWERRVGPLARALPPFCAARELDLAVVMVLIAGAGAERRLLLFCPRPGLLEATLRLLEALPLGLASEPVPPGGHPGTALFRQREASWSRKQLLPRLRALAAESRR